MKIILKIFGFSVLLLIINTLAQLAISMITNSYESIDTWWSQTVIALLMVVFSGLFSRRLYPASTKQALIYGVVFMIFQVGFYLIFAIPNGMNEMFGRWSTFLIFIGVAVGPVLMRARPRSSGVNISNNP